MPVPISSSGSSTRSSFPDNAITMSVPDCNPGSSTRSSFFPDSNSDSIRRSDRIRKAPDRLNYY